VAGAAGRVRPGNEQADQDGAFQALAEQPLGQLLLWVIYQGWTKRRRNDMDMPSDRHAWMVAERSGQVGFIANGVAVALIGVLVMIAAWQFDPNEASGLDAALRTLAGQPFGPYLLMAVALGLACYGVSASSTPATTGSRRVWRPAGRHRRGRVPAQQVSVPAAPRVQI
jgi:Domain of Unknown Function (DUF1206)